MTAPDADNDTRATHRRQLSKDYAQAMWCGDRDAAALIEAEIAQLEHEAER